MNSNFLYVNLIITWPPPKYFVLYSVQQPDTRSKPHRVIIVEASLQNVYTIVKHKILIEVGENFDQASHLVR